MTTMFWQSLFFSFILTTSYAADTCFEDTHPMTRQFKTLEDYKHNEISFNILANGSLGNFVEISKIHNGLQGQDFVSFDSNYIISMELANKEIRSIDSDSFTGLHCLVYLNLQGNKIDTLTGDSFKGLVWMRHLNLSENSLEVLPDAIFADTTKLISLDLSHNKLTTVNNVVINHLNVLRRFILNNNLISYLALENWYGLNELSLLDLSHNSLNHLKFDLNFMFFNLSRVLLNGNLLLNLDVHHLKGIAPKLAYVALEENFWPCNTLPEMIKFLLQWNILFSKENKTQTNINGVDCIADPSSSTPTPINPSSTTAPDVVISNEEVLQAISSLKSLLVFLIVIVIVVVVCEVIVKAGCAEPIKQLFRFRDDGRYRRSENIRLLPSNLGSRT